MKIMIGLVAAVVFYLSVVNAGPLGTQPQVSVIEVKQGDTVWKIAAEYSTARQDIREVIASIRHLNQLDHNVRIYPGQTLKVPKPTKK